MQVKSVKKSHVIENLTFLIYVRVGDYTPVIRLSTKFFNTLQR